MTDTESTSKQDLLITALGTERSDPEEVECQTCEDTKSLFVGPCFIPCPDCSIG